MLHKESQLVETTFILLWLQIISIGIHFTDLSTQ